MDPGVKPVNPLLWEETRGTVTNANAPVASMKDSGVLAGRGGGESSLSQQSGLKGQREAELVLTMNNGSQTTERQS